VNHYFATGPATVTANGPMAFIGPTVEVTIAAGQSILVTSQAALGANNSAASALTLAICYAVGGGLPVQVGGSANGLRLPSNTRINFPMTTIISGMAAGTYNVGLCGQTSSNAWNSNHTGSTSAIVF
jgi:hypothetical protein